jgi:hypothetical protein
MVPSSRGKRWTVPDNAEEAIAGMFARCTRHFFFMPQSMSLPRTLACSFMRVAVLDVASSGKSATSEDLAAIAAFQAPPPPIATDGKDFSALHAFHRSGSNVVVGNSPAKTILLSIRSEIRKEESVLSATRK